MTEDERLDSIIDSMEMTLSNPWELVKDWEVWFAAVPVFTNSWTQLSN